MASDIDRAGVAKAYERWAPVYDLVFGKVFDHGRQSTIVEADRIGGRILDVGVGTGLSLSDYSPTTKLCGVDISEPMLRKAQSRVRVLGLKNVETLAVMDAKNLAFKDSFFDAVVAQYVITAVPDPEATLDDFIRVLKPGGELILVNHIGAESGPRRIFELAFAPLARRLGWRPEFPWARLADWAAKHGGVSLTERRPMPPPAQAAPSAPARANDCEPMQPVPPRGTVSPEGTTTGQRAEPFGDKLARSDGVLCPPPGVDPEIRAPTPDAGNTPVIPPPGSPGGDPNLRPK